MNLKDLRYVIAVAEYRHFGHAAEACHVTQPTLSGQIKKLEEELGVILFERTKRSVVVTPMGDEILRHARLAVEHADQIVSLARARREPMTGPLHLGVIPTLSPYLMPLILRPLRQRYPNLRLVLSEEVTDRLLSRLHDHEIDVALIATTVAEPDLCELPLFEEPFWLAHPRQHALYDKDEIEPSDLAGLDLLLLTDAHCLSGQVRDVCAAAGHSDPTGMGDLRTASLETLLQLVGAGFGCTLVPALAIRGSWTTDAGVIARPIAGSSASRRVAMVYRRSYPRVDTLERLARLIREQLPNTVKRLASVSIGRTG